MTCRAWEGSLPSSSLPDNKHVARYCMYNYFPHPSNFRQSSGCINLLINEGAAGYGVYLMVLEVLRDAPNYRYSPDPKVWAYVLHAQDASLVQRVLNNYALFDIDGNGLLYSPWLCGQLGNYDEIKRKRQEAGRRGAASRWGGKGHEDGKAMAMPSHEDGKAMAYNITQSNVMQHNVTSRPAYESDEVREVLMNPGNKIDEQLFHALDETAPSGSGCGYIAQVCWHYGMGENVYCLLCKLTDGGNLTNSLYQHFCALVKRVQAEKYPIKMPNNFFLKKLLE